MAADDYHAISKHGKTTVTSAVSPTSNKKPKERVPAKPDMPQINCYLMCHLCSGYLIDATGIVECKHTFCKSCILKYLVENSYCPVCDVQLNNAKPHLSLRSDVIIQRLVYKLVPGLLVSEIRRRRDFHVKNGMDPVEAAELASNSIATEIEGTSDLSTVLSLDDVVSLSVEYFRSDDKGSTVSSNKVADSNGKPPTHQQQQSSTTHPSQNQQTQCEQQQQQKSNVKSNPASNTTSAGTNFTNTNTTTNTTTGSNSADSNSGNNNEQANDRRYLQCPAAVSVGLLKKFIRMKYGLSDEYRVDLLYNGDRDSILENDLTLLDVAFIFKWNKDEPMNFQYRIFERPTKSLMVYSGMKRPAPPVMDEPPDDDTASGPHSRSSMFSSSSAPSSKLPRLADNTGTSGNQGSVAKDNKTSGKSTTTSTTGASSIASSTSSTSTGSVISSKVSVQPTPTPTPIKVEKEEVEEEEDDDEDEDEDYELVERKEHMKGIRSSRRRSIKESMKRSVVANLRSQVPRTHSTDLKGTPNAEPERESSRNENSLSNSPIGKRTSNANVGKKKGNSHDVKEHKGNSKLSSSSKGISSDSLRLRVLSSSSSSDHSGEQVQSSGSLKLSISTSGVTPVVSSSSGEKKAPLKLSLGSVLAKGNKSPDRKHHKHKHHHHHKLRHRDKQGKGVPTTPPTPTASVTSQKPLKLSFTLNPPQTAGTGSTSQTTATNQSQNVPGKDNNKSGGKESGMEMKEQGPVKAKPMAGMHNLHNNSARTSASAHGHLNNISKSISVSVNTSGSSSSSSGVGAGPTKGSQYGNKILSPAELIPKNTGIEIQPTTIPISSSHGQISQHSQHQSSGSSNASNNNGSGSNNSHKHSHPLLPDSVHVPKSVTLIPVNPNSMNMPGSVSKGSSSLSQEKGGSGSQGNQNRINAHTFTHPITNKSLHQITVTEVPPPQNKAQLGGGNNMGSSSSGLTSHNNNNAPTHASISGTSSNPIEKVIANAANNKPQFNGPGSMEITKIYCGTSKENPTKKLKDRKGLDISISGTGINVSVNKSSQQKLEETLRQKVNIAIGGGNGSISVTAAPNNNINNSSLSGNGNNNTGSVNKIKSVSTAASLLSGKMPPGITIGPATTPNNSNNSLASGGSNMSGGVGNNSGNNLVKGLGFTLPPHLTAHPHNPNHVKNLNNQMKSDKMHSANVMNINNSRLMSKDSSISIIGKGNVGGGQQQQQQQLQPPPVEITISATGNHGKNSQNNMSNRGMNIINKSKMNDPLTSIFDITQGIRKSPSPTSNTKDLKGVTSTAITKPPPSIPQTPSNSAPVTATALNKNMANKRPYDLSNSSGAQNNHKKASKDLPEMKRGRSASTSSEPGKTGNSSSSGKSGVAEIPLDLSGRSTRTTPPLSIPHRESSKSPHSGSVGANIPSLSEKRAPAPSKISEAESKSGAGAITSSPVAVSPISNNFLSSKINVKSTGKEPFKGQSQSVTVSKSSPTQSSKIGSIVDSLAQKQAQQQLQQQQLQSMKKSQNQQQASHHHHPHQNAQSNRVTSPTSSSTHSSGGNASNMKVSPGSGSNNSSMNKSSVLPNSSSGLASPITATSLASPVIPITSPSPPGDHLRNLWTLSDTASAVRQGKLNSMNELLVAASLFSPPGHPHPLAGSHQLAGSPTGAPAPFNPNMFAQFGHHLAALGGNKIPPGIFDPHLMAALNAHNAQAVAGMRMHHSFVGSMSPPLTIPNAFYSHGNPGQQQQPSPATAAGGGLKIPNVASKPGTGNNNNTSGKSIPFAPLFSHSVPVSSPISPTSSILPPAHNAASGSVRSPTSSTISGNSISSVLPFTSSTSTLTHNVASNHSSSSTAPPPSGEQKHGHVHSLLKSGSSSHHRDVSSHGSSSGSSSKSPKINGTVSTALPVFPPGIHNPLLPARTSSSSNNSSGNSFQSGSITATAMNKSFLSPVPSKSLSSKGAIPNSMKISNFLPNKPKDSTSDANAEATITSGSNFGMPPLQAKPNFSVSPTRAPSNPIPPSVSIPKSPSLKESPISPVKAGSLGNVNQQANKPRSLTCASLLLPDSMYSKPPTHHNMLNSLSPTKGDHHGSLGLGSNRSRTPSSDSALSPGSAASKNTISPGTSPSNKCGNSMSKDGFRSPEETKSHKTISPTKDEIVSPSISKKDVIGNNSLGQPLARNFTTSVVTLPSATPAQFINSQSLNLNRPIPSIPAFMNRTNTTCPLSSTHILTHTTNTKDSLSLLSPSSNNKTPSPAKLTSPVKMSESHLPSPVFPFPGVSVPVQVKLQDDVSELPVPVVTSAFVSPTSSHSGVSPKLESKQDVSPIKAEKSEERRKRSASSPPPSSAEQISHAMVNKPVTSSFSSSDAESRKMKLDFLVTASNSCEIPAKVQKVETKVSSSVKNESETVASSPVPTTPLVSENMRSNDEKKKEGADASGSPSKKEICSESEARREPETKQEEGERSEEEKKGDVVADPPKEFSALTPKSPCKTEAETSSPVKEDKVSEETGSVATEKVTPAPHITVAPASALQPPPPSVQVLEEKQIKVEANREGSSCNAADGVVTEEKQSPTQIAADIDIPKSDEMSIQIQLSHQESKSLDEIPQERKSGEISGNESSEGENIIGDCEMEKVETLPEHSTPLGQQELSSETEMVVDLDDNQMEIDVDVCGGDEKMDETNEEKEESENIDVDVLKEDEDVNVDVVDVGGDEPMEVNPEIVLTSNNDVETFENCEQISETEDSCIANIITNEQVSSPQSTMEVVDNAEVNGTASFELIEMQSENTLPELPADNDEMAGSKNECLEEEEESEDKSSTEISQDDIITPEKLETSLEHDDNDAPPQQQSEMNEEVAEVNEEELLENGEKEESTPIEPILLFPENEASNFSQYDSESGDLIIDLGPSEEPPTEEEKDENVEIEETEQQTQETPKSPEFLHETKELAADEKLTETTENEVATPPEDDEVSSPLAISEPFIEDEEQNQPDDTSEEHEPSSSPADDDNIPMESSEPQVANVEPLYQDSIPNQITINPPPIEVNGVIKTDSESEKREDSDEASSPPPAYVSVCPAAPAEDVNIITVAPEAETKEKEEAATFCATPSDFVEEPEPAVLYPTEPEHSGKDALENSEVEQSTAAAGEEKESCSQLDNESNILNNEACSPSTATVEDNKNIADNGELAEGDKKIEEEQEKQQNQEIMLLVDEEKPLTSESPAASPSASAGETPALEEDASCNIITHELVTMPVHIPAEDDNVTSSQNISATDDSYKSPSPLATCASVQVQEEVAEPENNDETPMEIDDVCETELPGSDEMDISRMEDAAVPEIDDESMQIESDTTTSLPFTTDDSPVVHIIAEETAPTIEQQSSENIADVEVISATATITTASTAVAASVEDVEEEEDEAVVTPTLSTSSVSIKLDISANDDCGSNAAESLLPSSTSSLNPSSNNISDSSSSSSASSSSSSSSSSSPVDVSATGLSGIGSKSLETFGKVAAGLLATANSTINNNNNNTSLAPTSCEPMPIATTNANA